MDNIDFKFLIDNDSEPYIIFNSDGDMVYVNNSGEILLAYIKKEEIFDLSIKYAPKSFGTKIAKIDLEYSYLKFYAISISYNSDDWIAIKFHHKNHNYNTKNSKFLEKSDLNKLLYIAIEQFKIESKSIIKLFADNDIPEVKINQNNFLKLLRFLFSSVKHSSFVNIIFKFKIGEYLIIDNKKYQLILLQLDFDKRENGNNDIIYKLCDELFINITLNNTTIFCEIPLIK